MKLSLSLPVALGAAALSSAHRIPFKKVKHTPTLHRREFSPTDFQVSVDGESAGNTFDLEYVLPSLCSFSLVLNRLQSSVHDLIYIANVCCPLPVPLTCFLSYDPRKDHCRRCWSVLHALYALLLHSHPCIAAEYPVQLDTGSSDLWIKGTSYPIPGSTETVRPLACFLPSFAYRDCAGPNLQPDCKSQELLLRTLNLIIEQYAIGWAQGTVAHAAVEFVG